MCVGGGGEHGKWDESEFISKQENALSLIRLLAAIQVMTGHLIGHLQLNIPEIIKTAIFYYNGVPVFFALSGYLIWGSIERSSAAKEFYTKRFLRIYPELWVAVIVELITMIILYDGIEWRSFLLFGLGQSTVFQFWTPTSLRGYGVGAPNGALWTTGIIVQFYVVSYPFKKYLMQKNRKLGMWIIGFATSIMISWLGDYVTGFTGINILGKLFGQTIFRYFWIFHIGMFIADYSAMVLPVIKRSWWALWIAGILFYLTSFDVNFGYYLLWSIMLVSGAIGFAFRFPQFAIPVDISYGLFLYHMTVVNVFVNFNIIGNWVYALIICIISAAFAWISAITVGKYSYGLKDRLLEKKSQ